MTNLIWLFGASGAILVLLLGSRAWISWRAGKDGKNDTDSDKRYLEAQSLARTKLLMDSAIAITALVTIVATALQVLLS